MKFLKDIVIYLSFFVLACTNTDNEPPTVQIISPLDNSIVGGTVSVIITVSDNEVVNQVRLMIDDTLVQEFDSAPYTYNWNTQSLINNSNHLIIAQASDNAGNESADSAGVTVFNDTSGIAIFIWLFDPLDQFYDSTFGDTVDCSFGLKQALLANGYSPEIGTSLPVDISNYSVIFVTLGWFRC